jgi:hypothetical protein
VVATLCPEVTHVLCRKVRGALSHCLDRRTVLGRIVRHMRSPCGMRWQSSQHMELSKVAMMLGIDSEEALQTLRGELPHSAPVVLYAMAS